MASHFALDVVDKSYSFVSRQLGYCSDAPYWSRMNSETSLEH